MRCSARPSAASTRNAIFSQCALTDQLKLVYYQLKIKWRRAVVGVIAPCVLMCSHVLACVDRASCFPSCVRSKENPNNEVPTNNLSWMSNLFFESKNKKIDTRNAAFFLANKTNPSALFLHRIVMAYRLFISPLTLPPSREHRSRRDAGTTARASACPP